MIIETKIVEKPAFTVVGITETIHFDSCLPPSENAIAKLWVDLTTAFLKSPVFSAGAALGSCFKIRKTRLVRPSTIRPLYKFIRIVTSPKA